MRMYHPGVVLFGQRLVLICLLNLPDAGHLRLTVVRLVRACGFNPGCAGYLVYCTFFGAGLSQDKNEMNRAL